MQQNSRTSPSSSNKYIPPFRTKSIIPKLFKQARKNSEYLNSNFKEAFNEIAPELRVIGGLGRMKCIKKEQRHRIINRPTQVQKFSHTTTKLLPKFPLTSKLRPVACPQEKQPKNVFEHAERIKFAENLPPTPSSRSSNSIVNEEGDANKIISFNHRNPFNLDLCGLSQYQKYKSTAEDVEKRRNYHIIRRTMETKKLKTEGKERIQQQERNEKFGLPKLFKVGGRNRESVSSITSILLSEQCKAVAMMDKVEIRAESKRHYQHKEDKLRQQIRNENITKEKFDKEELKKLQEKEQNLIFQLADEHRLQMRLKAFPSSMKKCDYPVNEAELLKLKRQLNEVENLKEIQEEKPAGGEEMGISCGKKIGNHVTLRSFHDRLYSEPRGKINLHMKVATESTCLTHQQWLQDISNDPKITSLPPRVKLISCLKPSREPNNDKTMLFDLQSGYNKNIDSAPIESPIKQHVQKMNKNLKLRYHCEKRIRIKKSKNQIEKQLKRMNFMGIPKSNADTTRCDIKSIVEKMSIEKSESKEQVITMADGCVKFTPKIPCYKEENKCKEKKQKFTFSKAQPRGNDPKMLRADKSLPWIQSDINVEKKFDRSDVHDEKNLFVENEEDTWKIFTTEENVSNENRSTIKKTFNKIIANKLRNLDVDFTTIDDHDSQLIESLSTLSSSGTYFSNDSGSYLMVLDGKIPKSKLNISKKFQNKSLVTTEEQPPYDSLPYFIGDINVIKYLSKVPDCFHTRRTRSCANVRQRLNIESPAYDDELIGDENFKSPSNLATDVDDAYTKEFYNHRSRILYRYKPRTEMEKLRETLRRRMDIFYIQEKFIWDQIHAGKEEKILNELKEKIDTYNHILDSCNESTHRKSMKIVEQVKNYYQVTDKLRIQHESLHSQIEPLKMRIFFHGNEYVHRIMYEDIQYLLMPLEWREKHDHIHRTSEGVLENFRESIEQRGKRNLWNRDSISVETIMNFINTTFSREKSIFKGKLFSSGTHLLAAYKSLQSKSFKVLEKFTYATMILAKLEHDMMDMKVKSEKFVARYEETTLYLFKKWSFMQARLDEIRNNTKEIMKKPLEESFCAPISRDLTALCSHLFQDKFAVDASAKYFTAVEKITLIEKKVLELFSTLDRIPREVTDKIEKYVRTLRKKKMRVAKRAYKIELNIEFTMTQIGRLLAKPYQREKRKGKLPCSVLPKLPPKPKKVIPVLTPLEVEYAKAFMEISGENEIKFDENVKKMIQKIKNVAVPFYLDHLLEKRGFKMGKLSELQSEDILIDEEALLKHKDVLPEVRKKVKIWEEIDKLRKEQNIKRTSYMYE